METVTIVDLALTREREPVTIVDLAVTIVDVSLTKVRAALTRVREKHVLPEDTGTTARCTGAMAGCTGATGCPLLISRVSAHLTRERLNLDSIGVGAAKAPQEPTPTWPTPARNSNRSSRR